MNEPILGVSQKGLIKYLAKKVTSEMGLKSSKVYSQDRQTNKSERVNPTQPNPTQSEHFWTKKKSDLWVTFAFTTPKFVQNSWNTCPVVQNSWNTCFFLFAFSQE